jgi:iron complex outermembrane receptor protein
MEIGLSWEQQSLFHPIVDQIMVDFDGPGPAPAVEVFSLLVDSDQRNAGASFRYRLETGTHQLLFGANYGDTTVQGGNYRNLHGRPNGLSERVDESADSLELFAVDRWRFAEAWTLVYGAQYVAAGRDVQVTDAVSGDVRNPKANFSTVNPRLGLIYSLAGDSEVYASISRLYEPPTNYEIEDDVRGNNETLDAMHGEVFEIGLRGSSDTAAGLLWHWDVSAYYARIRDEILSVDDPEAPGNSLATNMDRTTHAGIEALVGASFAIGNGAHRLEPLVSFTLNRFSFDSDPVYGNNDLPAAPAWFARGEILYRHGNFSAGPTFDLVGRRYADFANSYAVDDYGLLGLRASYSGERWEFFGELRNLLDEDYIATVGVQNEAAPDARVLNPGAPLSVYLGARLRL